VHLPLPYGKAQIAEKALARFSPPYTLSKNSKRASWEKLLRKNKKDRPARLCEVCAPRRKRDRETGVVGVYQE